MSRRLTKLTAEKDTLLKRSEQLRAEQERSLQKEQLLKELRAEEERERAVQKQAEDDRQKLPEVLRRIAVGEAFTEKADAAKDRLAITDADHLKRTACRAENAQ